MINSIVITSITVTAFIWFFSIGYIWELQHSEHWFFKYALPLAGITSVVVTLILIVIWAWI